MNCSGQSISLRRCDKVSDEIKPHNIQNITYVTVKNKKFRSNRLEFQPSFNVKLLFIKCNRMERVLGNKVNFSDLVIYSLSAILTCCQFTNEPNREISRGVFQNRRGGQAFPFLPSPSPFHFFCSRSNFRTITRLETLMLRGL